jgi:hypothetical protein
MAVADGADVLPARTVEDAFAPDGLAAPRRDDYFRVAPGDLLGVDDALLR